MNRRAIALTLLALGVIWFLLVAASAFGSDFDVNEPGVAALGFAFSAGALVVERLR